MMHSFGSKILTAIFLLEILSITRIYGQQVYHDISRIAEVFVQLDYKYLLHIPDNQELKSELGFPLIVYLHDAEERGSDLNKVKEKGPAKIVDGQPKFPFAVLSPLCQDGQVWDPMTIDLLLNYILENNPIDTSRIYITGVGLGAKGALDWTIKNPDRFRAIAPVSGWGEKYLIKNLLHKPIWIFHGALDQEVPLNHSIEIVSALEKAGNESVKFTIFPKEGHDCWTRVYNNADLYNWFLTH